MKLKDILRDIDYIELAADAELEISGICYDSRQSSPGQLFVAVTGFASDGHRFIPMAVEKGASAVLCEKAPEVDVPYVLVKNTRYAMAIASRNFFGDPASKMHIIGLTGTNGKTTSTYLIKHMLEQCLGAKVGLIGTNANMIGDVELHTERTTPESYELHKLFADMYDAGCSYVVMEVSSHALVLDRVAGIKFEVGSFTNLTQDHLDFHSDMDDYAGAKAMLFARCMHGCVNVDDAYSKVMLDGAKCDVLTYSIDNPSGLKAENVCLEPAAVKFTAIHGEEKEEISLAIPGRFSVYNALGVIACGLQLGLSLSQCAEAMKSAKGVKGRVETVPTDGDYTVVIDYSHTPDSLENVLKTVREATKGRVVALFGCGGDRDRAKRPIMGRIGTELSDFAIITSDNPRTEDPDAIIEDILAGVNVDSERYVAITDRVEAIRYSIENHLPGDIIVLAGKGHETYQEINHQKFHMDEREIVADILKEREIK
ncbi:MAG: UDP-N-acetylmuramoyl-L-alanyl-D-glutamate--2,6-diaminopimelate ligase [Oscillospiraceae bacterium]|nr:UDP-N-acetylmuramoyl-L-alanyl-D-glutamate--2,6-diaminopimelate ligase [Oscillospiraceae bacterium]